MWWDPSRPLCRCGLLVQAPLDGPAGEVDVVVWCRLVSGGVGGVGCAPCAADGCDVERGEICRIGYSPRLCGIQLRTSGYHSPKFGLKGAHQSWLCLFPILRVLFAAGNSCPTQHSKKEHMALLVTPARWFAPWRQRAIISRCIATSQQPQRPQHNTEYHITQSPQNSC